MKTNILLTSLLLIFIITLLFVSKSFSGNAPKLPQGSLSQSTNKITQLTEQSDLSKISFIRALN